MAIATESNPLLARIVRSVVKAVGEDVPEYLREQGKETNNCLIHLRGDCINDNLRKFVVGDTIDLLPFKRYSYQGRLLVDRANKYSYSITTRNNLDTIPKKQRNTPHFLQSLLFILNGSLEAPVKQMALFDMTSFESEDFVDDYKNIVGELLDPAEGYQHYVIVYETDGVDVSSISIELLDKDFGVVMNYSLNEFIQSNILRLTDSISDITKPGKREEGDSKQFLHIRESVRPHTSELPDMGVSTDSIESDKGLSPKLHIVDEEA